MAYYYQQVPPGGGYPPAQYSYPVQQPAAVVYPPQPQPQPQPTTVNVAQQSTVVMQPVRCQECEMIQYCMQMR